MEIRHTEAVDFLKPLMNLILLLVAEDHGLNLISPEVFLYYRIEFQELVVVSDQFPQAVAVSDHNDGRFYLLALSQNDVRFFAEHATASRKWRWKIPKSLDDSKRTKFKRSSAAYRDIKRGTSILLAGSFHGQVPTGISARKASCNFFT